jgi:hypothetical protein
MKLFPSKKIMLHTSLSKAEVFRKLKKNIRPADCTNNNEQDLLFEGLITKNSFCIKPVINYSNTFIPEIKGEFAETGNGTRIAVMMKPTRSVMRFIIMWISGISFCALILLLSGFVPGGTSFAAIMPTAMLCIGINMINIGFNTESAMAKEELSDILNAEVTS